MEWGYRLPMRKKSILIVSPWGKPIKAIPVNFFTVSLFVIFMVCGFAAYFIPAHKFKLKTTDQNQKESLSAQNGVLYQRIGSALQMLSHLKDQISRLDAKKERVSELTGVGASAAHPKRSWLPPRRGSADYAGMATSELLQVAARQETILNAFAAGDNPFDSTPVCKPILGTFLVTQRFGSTRDPFTNSQKFHYGIDFAASPGTPVIATAAGVVSACDYSTFWGKRVVIGHARGMSTVYAHLGSVTVAQGRKVKRGDAIGTVGYSGLTTGPHVHYEIWCGGVAVDPEGYFFPARVGLAMSSPQ
jgi:murein DD-endopeptidase MepM/ murein hydrolase activator NlpD